MSRPATVSQLAQPLTVPSRSTTVQPSSATLTGLGPCLHNWPSPKAIRLVMEPGSIGAPAWLVKSLDRWNHLLTLPPNWDSYGAECIDPYLVMQALKLLAEVMGTRTPPPQIVPTHEGGVQLEWHEHYIDLEIEVAASSKVSVSFENLKTGANWEGTLSGDLGPVVEFLEVLAASETSS